MTFLKKNQLKKTKMKKNLIYTGLLCLVFLMESCQGEAEKNFDYGRVEDNRYVNSFFKFEIDIPKDWNVQPNEYYDKYKEEAKDLLAGDDKNLRTAIDATVINSAHLLTLFKYSTDDTYDFNPKLNITAENINDKPEFKTGKDILENTARFLKKSNLENTNVQIEYIDEEFEKRIIGNQEFYIMNATFNYNGRIIKQVLYSTIIKGFSIGAVMAFTNDREKSELINIFNTVKFYE